MKRLLKSKLFWLAAAYVCIFVVALVFAINTDTKSEHYDCTVEDIANCEKTYSSVSMDILLGNLQLTDEMSLALYFDHRLNNDEVSELEKLGVTIYEDSWIPPVGIHPYHVCGATAMVENICKLCDLDLVKKIGSAEPHAEFE